MAQSSDPLMAGKPHILADPHGAWCAWCLEYFDGESPTQIALNRHHVEQQWIRREQLPPSAPLEYRWDEWVVPAHAKPLKCHNELDRRSASAALALTKILSLPAWEQDGIAARAFNLGLFPLCVRIRQGLRDHYAGMDPDEQRRNFKFELVAAAGIWFFECPTLNDLLTRLEAEDPELVPKSHNPGYALLVANPYSTFGPGEDARRLIAGVKKAVLRARGTQREILEAKTARLNVALTLDLRDAARAGILTRHVGDEGQKRTAVIGQAWAEVIEGSSHRALDVCNQLQTVGTSTSFWQQLQELILRACVHYLAERRPKLDTIIGYLLQAQYIMACLGLRPWSIPEIRESPIRPEQRVDPLSWLFLDWLIVEHGIRRRQLEDLRGEWIGSSLKGRVWSALEQEGWYRIAQGSS